MSVQLIRSGKVLGEMSRAAICLNLSLAFEGGGCKVVIKYGGGGGPTLRIIVNTS